LSSPEAGARIASAPEAGSQIATTNGADITRERPVVVLGGGPAGLTAGYLLAKADKPAIILEATDMLGGIARTEVRDGYRFDLGGHRFFTKVKEVDDLWHEIMKEEFLKRPRQSRIYWNDKFLEYPLEGMDVIRKLGVIELSRCMASYLWAQAKPKGREDTFEAWVSNRFGMRLYNHFFKTYTEKLWGVPTDEIRAEWAAQRIKGLSFFSAARAAFFGNKGNKIKSLISEFNYPRFGPGQMWEEMARDIQARGGEIRLSSAATKLVADAEGKVVEVHTSDGQVLNPSYVISSLPLRATVGITSPEAPAEVRDAARGLRYREFLTVLLVIDGEDLFPDNWIYIHQPGVKVLRIQNFKSWSPWMVPEGSNSSSIGMEYFCFEGDDFWMMDDDKLVELASHEIEKLHLAKASNVKFGFVARVQKAYPIYDEKYAERVQTIRGWIETSLTNLTQVGRNGLHRYNNSDHSMLTAMRAVDNILLGTHHDIWAVNVESVYHEEVHDNENPYANDPKPPAMDNPLEA
jgi:protoporphyrinogen oxidase